MKEVIAKFTILISMVVWSQQNLIGNGDFENPTIVLSTLYFDSSNRALFRNNLILNNIFNWFTTTTGKATWEAKEVVKATLAKNRVGNLIKNNMCQDLTLTIGSTYQLELDYLIDEMMASGVLEITLNSNMVNFYIWMNTNASLRVQ